MLIALNYNHERIEPTPGNKAICPICENTVIAKCGRINIWHWSHVNLSNCDNWGEAESRWHYGWKKRFPIDKCEILINGSKADIVTPNNEVIKLRNTYISPYDINSIEQHFKDMIWIFNVADCIDNIELRKCSNNRIYYTFRWKHPRKHIAYATKPTILDLGDKLFVVKKMGKDTPCGGWGYLITINEFLKVNKFANNQYFTRNDNKF